MKETFTKIAYAGALLLAVISIIYAIPALTALALIMCIGVLVA